MGTKLSQTPAHSGATYSELGRTLSGFSFSLKHPSTHNNSSCSMITFKLEKIRQCVAWFGDNVSYIASNTSGEVSSTQSLRITVHKMYTPRWNWSIYFFLPQVKNRFSTSSRASCGIKQLHNNHILQLLLTFIRAASSFEVESSSVALTIIIMKPVTQTHPFFNQ